MGLALFKRKQRYQGGSEAVPSDLPTPPDYSRPPEYAQPILDEFRNMMISPEEMAQVRADPTNPASLKSIARAVATMGALASGGEGERVPTGTEVPRIIETPKESFAQRMAREEDMNEAIKSFMDAKRPPQTVDEAWDKYTAFDRARGVEVPGRDYFENAWELFNKPTPEEPPHGYSGGATIIRGYPPTHMLNCS